VQLDPLEFLDKIAAFIPVPHRHRRHYHGVFAPNSPMRKKVVAYANRRLDQVVPVDIQNVAAKTKRVSFDWAALIARIYEVDPLTCTKCGQKIRILGFVTHTAEIHRILSGLGWPLKAHDFDPPHDFCERDICQLILGTVDGFPEMEVQVHCEIGPDPPFEDNCSDPPHWDDSSDPPHGNN
jgi:hypothetical protein